LISIIDNAFNPNGIYFEYVCKNIFYNNTERATNGADATSWCTWFDVDAQGESIVPRHSDGIDVFIVTGFGDVGDAGRVSSIPGKFMVINGRTGSDEVQNSRIESTTIIHELGHLFGLMHMFHGSYQNLSIWPTEDGEDCSEFYGDTDCGREFTCPYTSAYFDCTTGQAVVDPNECAEDATNGSVAGDYIPDTPPSYILAETRPLNSNCQHIDPEGRIDHKGDPKNLQVFTPDGDHYDADITNFISVTGQKECRDHYTEDQWTVMKNHIQSHPILAAVHSDKGDLACECDYENIIYLRDNANWSDVISEYELDMSLLEDYEIVVESSLNLDVDYSFGGVIFTMGTDAELNLTSSSNIFIQENQNDSWSTMMACDGRWRGIKIESGSSLSLAKTNIYTTQIAIDAEDGSSLRVDNIVVLDALVNAIRIVGDVSMEYNNVKVTGAGTAIFIKDSPQYYNLNSSEISDATVAVNLFNSSGHITGLVTGDVLIPIVLDQAHNSMAVDNTLGYDIIGMIIRNTIGGTIAQNSIGTNFQFGPIGMLITNSSLLQIRNNPKIIAEQFGISGTQLFQVDIHHNDDISSSGIQSTVSGGIRLTVATECDVTDNYIYASEVAYGIESNNGTLNSFRNNYVSISSIPNLFRSAAIRSVGCISEEFIENETYSSANANGIMAQNTGFGLYHCNFIYDSHDALCIEHNSEYHHLIANHKIDAHNFDFVTRSKLGVQFNEGNEYEGGSVRGFLSDEDLAESRFWVDEDEPFHMPSDPIPGNDLWYRNNDLIDEFCSGDVGPGGQLEFFTNPARLCDYWEDIKKLKITEPELFLIKVTHLIRYYDARPWLTLPDCIALDPIFIDLCGFNTVMDGINRLSNNGKIDPSRSSLATQISDMLNLQQEYLSLTDPLARQSKFSEIATLYLQSKTALDQEFQSDEASLESIKGAINSINCSEHIMQVIRDVWVAYITELGVEDFDFNLRLDANISNISQLCSDEYGDAVHLARYIASAQGSNVYYDTHDGCNDVSYSSPRSTMTEVLAMNIIPNPTIGTLNIEFSKSTTGKLEIYTMTGSMIETRSITELDNISLELEKTGIHIVRFIQVNGDIIIKRIINIE